MWRVFPKHPNLVWSFALLKPHADKWVRFHRRLLIQSLKPGKPLLKNGVGLVYWYCFSAWRLSYLVAKQPRTAQPSRFRLNFVLLKQGLGTLLPPAYYFKYPPADCKRRPHALNYLYAFQSSAFHQITNRSCFNHKRAILYASDKHQFAQEMMALGVRVVPGVCVKRGGEKRSIEPGPAYVPRLVRGIQSILPNEQQPEKYTCLSLDTANKPRYVGRSNAFACSPLEGKPYYARPTYPQALDLFFQKKALFCKPNQGSNARDAFVINYDKRSGEYDIEILNMGRVEGKEACVHWLKKTLRKHPSFLIQPFLSDHDTLKTLSPSPQSCTFRVITGKLDGCIQALYVQLEVPYKQKANRQTYLIWPLDTKSFTVDAFFLSQKANHAAYKHAVIPNLPTVIKQHLNRGIQDCILAHEKSLDLASVAFDLIITQTGPFMIEANVNWSVEVLFNVVESLDTTSHSQHPLARWFNQVATV